MSLKRHVTVKYAGQILRVEQPALGSDDSNLDQSGMSTQILPEPNTGHVTLFFSYKITTLPCCKCCCCLLLVGAITLLILVTNQVKREE